MKGLQALALKPAKINTALPRRMQEHCTQFQATELTSNRLLRQRHSRIHPQDLVEFR